MKPPAKNPCGSCPYRRDVPSGIWDPSMYKMLPPYDEDLIVQPRAVFGCHQDNDKICGGWLACHGGHRLLSLRLAIVARRIAPADVENVISYTTDVPLFDSGTEAAEHGMRDVEKPAPEAVKAARKILKKRGVIREV